MADNSELIQALLASVKQPDNAMRPEQQNALAGGANQYWEMRPEDKQTVTQRYAPKLDWMPNLLRQYLMEAIPPAALGFRANVPLARMPPAPKPPPQPVNPATGARYGSEPTPEFGSTEWARGLASKIENSPVVKHAGPAAAGSYLASKIYEPIASGAGSVVDWWNDPNGPVVGQALSSQMSRYAPPWRPGGYSPQLPYFPPEPNSGDQ